MRKITNFSAHQTEEGYRATITFLGEAPQHMEFETFTEANDWLQMMSVKYVYSPIL